MRRPGSMGRRITIKAGGHANSKARFGRCRTAPLARLSSMTTVESRLACAQATVSDRVASFDWDRIGAELDESGYGVLRNALTAGECASLAQLSIRRTSGSAAR